VQAIASGCAGALPAEADPRLLEGQDGKLEGVYVIGKEKKRAADTGTEKEPRRGVTQAN
jgi:hypothetical protein